VHLQRLAAVCLFALLLPQLAAAADAPGRHPGRALDRPALRSGGQPYSPGVVVIKFASGAPYKPAMDLLSGQGGSGLPEVDALIQRHQVQSAEPISPTAQRRNTTAAAAVGLSRIFLLHYAGDADALEIARDFDALTDIEYAEPLFVYELSYNPNDTDWNLQSAYFNQMQLPAAYDIHHDSNGVVIAIVDGGTKWDHQDLVANVWSNTDEVLDGTDTDGNGFIDDVRGWNFANGTNDPTGLPQTPGSADHGTHVAGIACATFDNNLGIAGASANAQFMPVCTSHPTLDTAISFGYQGILYAVDNGADIINCSWGGQGNPSSFEQTIIEYAWQNDVVVVAAAGNNNNSQSHYPSSYEHVLSIANVTSTDVRSASSNYGPDIDVSAQGQSIYAPIDTPAGNAYGYKTGTSMASPHAAAIAALVQKHFPLYNADQVAQRVRVTADNIDAQNPSYVGQLGFGRVNAQQALTMTTPAITITERSWTTTNGDQVLEPGESVSLMLQVTNHLDSASTIDFTLTEDSPYISITQGATALGSMSTLESVPLPDFTFDIDPGTPIQHVVTFTLTVTSASPAYSDADRFRMVVQPVTATHAANQVATTVTSVGRLGFGLIAGGTGSDGIGFSYAGGDNLLFEGAMILGTGSDSLSNAARGLGSSLDDDFVTSPGGTPEIDTQHPFFAEYGVASFTDAGAGTPLQLSIRQESWVRAHAPDDDYLTLTYSIRNDGPGTLGNLHVGWFFDWDIDGGNYATNQVGYDAGRGLGYAWDSGNGPDTYVGIRTLTSPGTTSFRAIWNDQGHPNNPSWGVYDGYTDTEKWETISGGIVYTTAGPADISLGLGTGPLQIAAGESLLVAFAVLAGDDLSDLQANADAAQFLWDNPPTDHDPATTVPSRLLLAQNAPNPFNPSTVIRYDLPMDAMVRLEIFDVRGRLIRTLRNGPAIAGRRQAVWDGRDDLGRELASGAYFYRLRVDERSITRKMQLLK